MNDQKTTQARQTGPETGTGEAALAPTGPRRPPAASLPRPPAAAADAGAVLRRSPDPDSPGSWRVATPRPRSPIVDTTDSSAASPLPPPPPPSQGIRTSSIVDNTDTWPRTSGRSPSSTIVDAADQPVQAAPFPSIVDNMDGFETMPVPPPRPGPVPTRLKGPEARKVSGPSGPDADLVRRLRDARKRKVADRAKARGRDPGAGSRQVAEGVTRSEKTHEQYLERGRMLVRRYRRETGLDNATLDTLDPVEFVNWFFSLKPTLKPTAWRPYRQAAKAILSSIPHEETEAAIAMIDADVAESSERQASKAAQPPAEGPRNKLPRKTSALKEKRIPKNDFDRTVSYLRHFSRSRFAPVLVDWMIAGVTTGLRPIEWQATDIEIKEDRNAPGGRHVWLYVLNAKSTNGRANGLVRTIDLSHFRDETLMAVQRMSKAGSEWLLAGTYDSMQSQCAQLLYSVSEKVIRGNKVYSLYSMRHQFVANAKSYHKPEAVSALCGHVVTDTAVSSYGKKRSCWEPEDIQDRADPVPEEVATVKQRLVFFEERVRLQQEAGLVAAPAAVPSEEA